MQPEIPVNKGDLEKKDRKGNAPLHLAAGAGHTEAVRILLGLGAITNQRNQEGEAPLHLAAESGHRDVVKMLLDAGADPTLQDNNGATPSHLAASGGHIEIMDLLSRRSDNKERIKQLHEAAESGSIKELTQLLEVGLPLDEKNERGETALYVAAAKGHRKFAEMLLQAGADPTIATDDGSTVLHAAAMSGQASLIKLLTSNSKSSKGVAGDKKDKTIQTAKNVSSKEWQDIYKKCENLVLTDSDGDGDSGKECEYQLPVIEEYLAALFTPDTSEQQLDCMRQFLQELLKNLGKRMDVRANLGRGATLLHLAAVCRADDTVRILLKREANVRAKNLDGVTPLIMGCAGGSLEVVRLLVEAGAEPLDVDDSKRTALHYAVRLKSLPMTKYLLSLGLDPNFQDVNGNTPLHIASVFSCGHDVIAALCDAGGDLLARNKDRLYPFSLARDADTFKLLQPPGFDEKEEDKKLVKEKDGDKKLLETCAKQTTDFWKKPIETKTYARLKAARAKRGEGSSSSGQPQSSTSSPGTSGGSETGLYKVCVCVNRMSEELDGMLEEDMVKESINEISRGRVDVNSRYYQGYTPLHMAARYGAEEAARKFIKKKADIHALTRSGLTPIMLAAAGGSVRIIKMLVRAGANVLQGDSRGLTPIHVASYYGHESAVRYFHSLGLDLDAQTAGGETALHIVSRKGNLRMAIVLLQLGANKDIPNTAGVTPLLLAVAHGHEHLPELLYHWEK